MSRDWGSDKDLYKAVLEEELQGNRLGKQLEEEDILTVLSELIAEELEEEEDNVQREKTERNRKE